MNSTTLILVGVAVVLGLLLLSGGATPDSESEPPVSTEGTVSTISASGPLQVDVGEDLRVGERETVQLTGSVEGAAAGTIRYQWTAQGGLGYFDNPTIQDPVFTAPSACGCEGCVLLTLTVVDARGAIASDSLVLTVRDPLVCPPEPSPAVICVPADPCARPAEATCPAQPDVPCETPCITEVPPPDPCSEAIIPCPCADGDCESAWISTWPFAPPKPSRAADRPKPRIVRHFPSHIAEGSTCAFTGTISNPTCVSACFVWVASKGWFEESDTLTPTYHAPMSDRPKGEPVTISLIVYDGFDGRSYDQVRLTIDNVDYDGPRVP